MAKNKYRPGRDKPYFQGPRGLVNDVAPNVIQGHNPMRTVEFLPTHRPPAAGEIKGPISPRTQELSLGGQVRVRMLDTLTSGDDWPAVVARSSHAARATRIKELQELEVTASALSPDLRANIAAQRVTLVSEIEHTLKKDES